MTVSEHSAQYGGAFYVGQKLRTVWLSNQSTENIE